MYRIIICAMLVFFHPIASGQVIWDWEVVDPGTIFSPTENVTMTGRLYNDILSEPISNLDVIPGLWLFLAYTNPPASPLMSISDNYEHDFNGGFFNDQFSGVVINPGESFEFNLFTLSPINGDAMVGSYSYNMVGLNLAASLQDTITRPVPFNVANDTTTLVVVTPFAIIMTSIIGMVLVGLRK